MFKFNKITKTERKYIKKIDETIDILETWKEWIFEKGEDSEDLLKTFKDEGMMKVLAACCNDD